MDRPSLSFGDDEEGGGVVSGMADRAASVLALPSDEVTCPECDALLEDTYVRDPSQQGHWRGVPGVACPECDYARADTVEPEPDTGEGFLSLLR